jgi:hypothetical protein
MSRFTPPNRPEKAALCATGWLSSEIHTRSGFVPVLMCAVLMVARNGQAQQCGLQTELPNPTFSALPLEGSERPEREFKQSVYGPGVIQMSQAGLAEEIRMTLDAAMRQTIWKMPEQVGAPYQPRVQNGKAVTHVFYLDFFFDTEDDLNYRFDAVYRFRQRFDNARSLATYLAGGANTADRRESMAKVKRNIISAEKGLAQVTESRLEYLLPQLPGIQIDEMFCTFRSGIFKVRDPDVDWTDRGPFRARPAQTIIDYLNSTGAVNSSSISFEPRLAMVIERLRQHMMIPAARGSMPEEAILITVDRAMVYDMDAMLQHMRGQAEMPQAAGEFVEVEVELERNIQAIVTDNFTRYTGNRYNALLQDQETVMNLIRARFGAIDQMNSGGYLAMEGQPQTKYAEAYALRFNLAKDKFAYQSSTGWDGSAARAVDGNVDGNFWNGSVNHTLRDEFPYWDVDLGDEHSLTAIEIWNRTDCCADRLTDFLVILSPYPITIQKPWDWPQQPDAFALYFQSPFGRFTNVKLPRYYRQFRYARVQMAHSDWLHLAEVRVIGK